MGAMAVVVAKEGIESRGTNPRVGVGSGIGPLALARLDETLGLPVRSGSVGARSEMPEPQASHEGSKHLREVGAAIVGHHSFDLDASLPEPRHGSAQERGAGDRLLVGEDLRIGDAAGIIDTDMQVLPSSSFDGLPPVPMDPVSYPLDAGQLL